MTHRIGIIGLGSIGQRMLDSIASHDAFTACAAWDPDARARDRTRHRHPSLRLSDDSASVLGAPDVDLIYIACPPERHREYALAAIDAGKPILCEKPLGVDLDASRQLVGCVESSGLPNAVNLLFGSARSGEMVATALEQGAVGDVAWVELRLHLPRWSARRMAEAPWLAARAQGGFVREVVTHYVFLSQRLFGPLCIRHARLQFPADAAGAETLANIELVAGNILVSINGTTAGTGPEVNEYIVWGSHASYRIRDIHLLDIARDDRWEPAYEPVNSPERDTHLRQLDNLARLLAGEAHALPDFRAALAVQEIVEAIVE